MSRIRNAVTAGLFLMGVLAIAGPASASAESSAKLQGDFWDYSCNYGRACILLTANRNEGRVYNFDGCGGHPIRDYYSRAQSHGNGFTVYYNGGNWDYVPPNSVVPLDPYVLATWVNVWC